MPCDCANSAHSGREGERERGERRRIERKSSSALGSQRACNSESNFVRTEMKLTGIISLTALLATCLVISAQVWCFLSLHGLQRTPILSILKGKRGRQEKVVDGIMMMMMMMISGKIFGSIELCVCVCVCLFFVLVSCCLSLGILFL